MRWKTPEELAWKEEMLEQQRKGWLADFTYEICPFCGKETRKRFKKYGDSRFMCKNNDCPANKNMRL